MVNLSGLSIIFYKIQHCRQFLDKYVATQRIYVYVSFICQANWKQFLGKYVQRTFLLFVRRIGDNFWANMQLHSVHKHGVRLFVRQIGVFVFRKWCIYTSGLFLCQTGVRKGVFNVTSHNAMLSLWLAKHTFKHGIIQESLMFHYIKVIIKQ